MATSLETVLYCIVATHVYTVIGSRNEDSSTPFGNAACHGVCIGISISSRMHLQSQSELYAFHAITDPPTPYEF